ncbi:DUF4410 domain-containing protein [Novosphingobium sp.]|uniref:DUF4410 domain-containing protein n=1 Tax=Novosphingobium sp. TaxID=1874826 RepID=UPI00333F0A24
MRSTLNARAGAAGLALALAGCAAATTAPSIVQPLAIDRTAAIHITDVTVDNLNGIWIKEEQRFEIRNKIQAELQKQALAAAPVVAGTPVPPQTFAMKVMLTRFDEGNAMARLALIGLGQVHIEGTVTLADAAGHPAGQYKIKKTFAAGGIVGAVTSTGSVEDGFAKSVVAGLTQKPGSGADKAETPKP